MDIPATKVCSKCQLPKDIERFSIDKSKKDGRHTVCKGCKSGYDKTYREIPENKTRHRQYKQDNRKHYTDLENARRQKDPEKFRAQARANYAKNPERVNTSNRRWVQNNPEKVRSTHRKWRIKNHDRLLQQQRARRVANPEKMREYLRAYYVKHRKRLYAQNKAWEAKHPESVKASKAKWAAQHPDSGRDAVQRRRARLKNASTIVRVNRAEIIARDRSICHICHKKVSREDMSLDHLIPLACGGSHTPENLAVAHKRCNSRRYLGRTIPAQLRLLP